jgi:hypothetical protein
MEITFLREQLKQNKGQYKKYIRFELGVDEIKENYIQRSRLRWFEHLKQMRGERIPKNSHKNGWKTTKGKTQNQMD